MADSKNTCRADEMFLQETWFLRYISAAGRTDWRSSKKPSLNCSHFPQCRFTCSPHLSTFISLKLWMPLLHAEHLEQSHSHLIMKCNDTDVPVLPVYYMQAKGCLHHLLSIHELWTWPKGNMCPNLCCYFTETGSSILWLSTCMPHPHSLWLWQHK